MDAAAPAYAGLGLALPSVDAFDRGMPVLEAARAAEQAELDHVWMPDHLVFHVPLLESITALSCVAGATSRLRLGFAILNLSLRTPVWLAKQLATLAVLAPERLLLGTGVGGEYAPEFEAAGVPLAGRGKRVDETLELLGRLMSGEAVEHDGIHSVNAPALAPVPAATPPILIGGRSAAALRRTARNGDAWFPMWMDPPKVAEGLEQVRAQAAEHGRPAPGAALVAFANVTDDPAAAREEAAEMTKRQYGMPFDRVERWTLIGDAEAVAERLAAYREIGVEGFVIAPATPTPLEQIEPLAEVRRALQATAGGPAT